MINYQICYNKIRMNVRIPGILLLVISIGMVANAYAHTLEVVGDYKIEVGWENEPPVKGLDNAITFEVGIASDYDKAQAEAEDAAMEGLDQAGMDHYEEGGMNMTDMAGGTAEQEHQMALDLEKQGKFADAAEHHHMAATDLEKDGDYAGAAEQHNMAADDLEKAGKHTEAIEHQHMATKDLAMVGTNVEHGSEMNNIAHNDHEEEHDLTTVRGLLNNFKAEVTLAGTTTPLKLVEDPKFPGVYHADFTPSAEGFPMVQIVGTLAGEDVDITFHPEKIEGLSILPPLKQIKEGISPKNVECKSDYILLLRTSSNASVCVHPDTGTKLVEMGWGTKV